MIFKIRLGNTKLTFSISKIEDVVGMNSMLGDKTHILMWDFDYTERAEVITELKRVQWTYNLPVIYVLKTAEKKGFHAYCFHRVTFKRACTVLSATNHIDMNYFRMGTFRGYWTLRVSKKSGRSFELSDVLSSEIKEDATLKELKHFTMYDTTPDGTNTRIIKIGRQGMRKQNKKHQYECECEKCGAIFPEFEGIWTDPDGLEIIKCPYCGEEFDD